MTGTTGPQCICDDGYVPSDTELDCISGEEIVRRERGPGVLMVVGGAVLLGGSLAMLVTGIMLLPSASSIGIGPGGIILTTLGVLILGGGGALFIMGISRIRSSKMKASSAYNEVGQFSEFGKDRTLGHRLMADGWMFTAKVVY
jgi:hypothetical protein